VQGAHPPLYLWVLFQSVAYRLKSTLFEGVRKIGGQTGVSALCKLVCRFNPRKAVNRVVV
jgi:hypothetical protein